MTTVKWTHTGFSEETQAFTCLSSVSMGLMQSYFLSARLNVNIFISEQEQRLTSRKLFGKYAHTKEILSPDPLWFMKIVPAFYKQGYKIHCHSSVAKLLASQTTQKGKRNFQPLTVLIIPLACPQTGRQSLAKRTILLFRYISGKKVAPVFKIDIDKPFSCKGGIFAWLQKFQAPDTCTLPFRVLNSAKTLSDVFDCYYNFLLIKM